MSSPSKAAQLRAIAAQIRDLPPNPALIAAALDLVADAMEPCIDCGAAAAPDGEALEVTGNEDAGV
ncbi:hypothetical protein HUU62_04320 [Rhodoferax sp. 4810]|nr:hypothetical protein [Rhodoferax jenense]